MRYQCPLLVVEDINRSKKFYCELFGLRVVNDFGANITLTGGLSLQTRASWEALIGKDSGPVRYRGNDAELYFEGEDFDEFIERLRAWQVDYVHEIHEQPWGQRAVRIYDPDGHIIEIGEDMAAVCLRFLNSGMTLAQVAARMDVSESYVTGMVELAEQKSQTKQH